MSYIGNSPGVASQRVESAFTATSSQTVFTPTSGYTLGYCDVYQNGVKLVNGDDYTASDGATVTLATGAASGDSIVIVASFPRGLSDGYLKSEADAKYLTIANPSYTGTLTGGTGAITIGTNHFVKDSSGNVTLNTTTGYGKFTVQNTAGTGKVMLDNYASVPTTENVLSIYADASRGYIQSYNNGYKDIAVCSGGGNLLVGATSAAASGYRAYINGALGIGSYTAGDWQVFSLFGNRSSTAQTVGSIGAFNNGTQLVDINFQTNGTTTGGAIVLSTALAGSLTERARIDSNGNLLLNTNTVSSIGGNITNLQIVGKSTVRGGGIRLQTSDASLDALYYVADGLGYLGTISSTPLVFQTGNTERARIDSSGNFTLSNGSADFQKTAAATTPFRIMNAGQSGNNRNIVIFDSNYGSGNSTDLWFTKNSSSSYIWRLMVDTAANGGSNFSFTSGAGGSYGVQLSSTTATAWSQNSDIRLKDVTGAYENALAGIAQLEAIKFTWKSDESKKPCVGVSAQSVLPVVPEAVEYVTHVGDESGTEYMTVRYTELIPILIAGIQEQQALITQLQADVAALKGTA